MDLLKKKKGKFIACGVKRKERGMKIFIWKYLDGITDNHHSGAGVVVIAETLKRAKELLKERGVQTCDEAPRTEYDRRTGETIKVGCDKDYPWCYEHKVHDSFYMVQTAGEEVFIFPDAGCC